MKSNEQEVADAWKKLFRDCGIDAEIEIKRKLIMKKNKLLSILFIVSLVLSVFVLIQKIINKNSKNIYNEELFI